jgi:hypothetical protein
VLSESAIILQLILQSGFCDVVKALTFPFRKQLEFRMDFCKNFFISSTAICITYPFDTLRTQYQISSVSKLSPTSIYKDVGLLGYYKGLKMNLFSYPVFWAVYFPTESHAKKYTDSRVLQSFISSSVASCIANPFFVLKTRMQAQPEINTKSLKMISDIFEKEGLRGFAKGINMTLANNMKLTVQFPMFYWLKEDKEYNTVLSSFMAKLAANNIAYPSDVVRTRIRNSVEKLNPINVAKDILKEQGLKGFYRGCMWYNFVSIPNFMIIMTLKDYIG